MSRVTIAHLLVDTCTIYPTSTPNKFGTRGKAGAKQVNCRWRDINLLDQPPSREVVNADAMVWFFPEETVFLQMPVDYKGESYRITSITNAKRGAHTDTDFIKCLVAKKVD